MNHPTPPPALLLPAELTRFAALVGIDWSENKHDLHLYDVAGHQYEPLELSATPEALDTWLQSLRGRFAGQPVAIVMEECRSALAYQLMDVEFITLYLVNPATAARYRKTFTPSGAKDDPTDAADLLDLLLKHSDRLRVWHPHDPATYELGRLCERRRRQVEVRTAQVQRLGRELKSYFPQALSLVGDDLTTNLASDFLRRWPSLPAVQRAKTATVRAFYYGHHCRSQAVLQKRLALIAKAKPPTVADSVVTPAVLNVTALAATIRGLNDAIATFDRAIATRVAQHPEAAIFASLPGAGPVLVPRLIAFFGTDRSRYPTPTDVQQYTGIAPVLVRSGNQQWIHRRWCCPKFIRQTFHEYAHSSFKRSVWAHAYYRQQRARGKKHNAAIRALAFKWIRVTHACWQSHTPYDEARYLAALQRHGSPFAPTPAATTPAATNGDGQQPGEKSPQNR